MGAYRIDQVANDVFHLYEAGEFLTSFSRLTFREKIEAVASRLNRSSNWIGSILRLFLKQFPPSMACLKHSKCEVMETVGHSRLVDYLRSKGFRVNKPMPFSDIDIIRHLEAMGYEVEGVVGDYFYSTKDARCLTR